MAPIRLAPGTVAAANLIALLRSGAVTLVALGCGRGEPLRAAADGGLVVREAVVHSQVQMGAGDAIGGEGVVDENAVARLVRGQLSGIRACYESELRHGPTLEGRLEMTFTIGPNGRPTGVSAGGPMAALSPTFNACVAGRLGGLQFPAPDGGTVEFFFPFGFTPGGGRRDRP